MYRKEIMVFLSISNVGAGEFCCDEVKIWGGTGWEILGSGKPLLQSFHYSEQEYKAKFKSEPPPILNVKNRHDVTMHLTFLYENRHTCNQIGADSRDWFNKHNGLGLAKKWLELLDEKTYSAS